MEQLKATSVESKQAAHKIYADDDNRLAFNEVSLALVEFLKHTEEGEQAMGAPLVLATLGADFPNVIGTAIMYGYKLRLTEEQLEKVKNGDSTCIEHKKLNCPECKQ